MILDVHTGGAPDAGAPDERLLGTDQWRWLRSTLRGEAMADTKALIVCSSMPLVFFTETQTRSARNYMKGVTDMWHSAAGEQAALLHLLLDWKRAVPGREVSILAGDTRHAVHTDVVWNATHVFSQLITSAIANREIPSGYFVGLNIVLAGNNTLAGGFSFDHSQFTKASNYGVLTVREERGGGASVTQEIYVSDGKYGEQMMWSA